MTTRIQQFPFGGVGPAGGIDNVVEDLTPQLGGNLDLNGKSIIASDADGPQINDVAASATVPSLIPDRAVATSGIGTSGVSLDLIVSGQSRLRVGTGIGNENTVLQPLGTGGQLIGSVSGSFGLINNAASDTVPTLLPNSNSTSAGIGANALGNVSIITGSLERLRADATELRAFLNLRADTLLGPGFLNEDASSINPTLVPVAGDPDTGLGRHAGNVLSAIAGGVEHMRWNDSSDIEFFFDLIADAASSPRIRNIAASATVPTLIPNRLAATAGIGANAAGSVSMITASTEVGRFDQSVTANDMRFLLYDVTAGTLVRVSRGAADSESLGFRALRVPN